MAKWMDYSKKEHLGSVVWQIARDWRILQWGSIFSIPPEELKKYNWGEIGFGLTVEVPIIKSEYDYTTKGQNSKVYYTVILDWEYLLERQAILFGSLGWAKEEITNFLTEQINWLDKRSQELEKSQKELSLIQAAENMAKITGQSVDYWIEKIKESNKETIPEPEPIEEEEKIDLLIEKVIEKEQTTQSYPKGTIKKLGNEYFIENTQGRWKIGLTSNYLTEIGSLTLDSTIGYDYFFIPDTETKAPKSRQAKGWVKQLVWK